MKKKIRTVISVLLVALCMATGLSACKKTGFNPDTNVTVVTREDGSGTKSAVMEMLGLKGKADVAGALTLSSTAAVLTEIKSNSYAIGFESLGYVTDEVKTLKVNGVEASVANVKDGSYKLSRPLSIVYKAETITDGAEKAFFNYLQSSEAQTIITADGYISTKENPQKYRVISGLSGKIDISGSTSLEPLMIKLAEEFEKIQSGVEISVGGGGSGTGYKNGENGTSDFGMISETFKQEKAPGCVSYEVAKDGIAMIVNKNNTCDNLTMEQLKAIYNCEAGEEAITKWSQVTD